ncbi:MAG: Ada metal-binding domain-containing protein [Cyclobacteriaceae bacterium]|nr:MAG: Ada metal-binding domain-containing protein [Cyclobacteriaceae bacterium]
MWYHKHVTKEELRHLLRNREVVLAGNLRLKIYGTLRCYSGKRMKRENRVFFQHEEEARLLGYRPCKNCGRKNSSFKSV